MTYRILILAVALAACGHGDDDGDAPPPAPAPRIQDTYETRPQRVGADSDWLAVAPGVDSLCALKRAGSRWCLGNNHGYQFGAPDPLISRAFVRTDSEYWQSIDTGNRLKQPFGCGVTKGGVLQCWGTPPASADHDADPQWLRRTNWRKVEAGTSHVCGITSGGSLACWGVNDHGQLGVEGAAESKTPVIVDEAHDWLEVSAGERHTCAVRADRTLWCWGAAEQAGANGIEPHTPAQISAAADWVGVSAGDRHTCALRASGAIWCWGRGESGQLGVGVSNEPWLIPVSIDGSGFTSLSAGANHTCAIRDDARLLCWGANDYGQLGVGSRTLRDRPVSVGTTRWKHVDAVGAQTCAVRDEGALYCWGRVLADVGYDAQ